jgi:hypothetical protein
MTSKYKTITKKKFDPYKAIIIIPVLAIEEYTINNHKSDTINKFTITKKILK